ncbi:hypothetical protein VT03_16305 [Planctomyces sp. SH-PL14]|nr:hypothetical protein VT03_16305 [Planctomyces sp. SH-PL14]
MQGGNALLPAGGLAVERFLKEVVSKRGRGAGCPLTNPRGFQSEGGFLNAGSTKRSSVAYHGSSWKCLRRQGGETPLTPAAVARRV